ncbi:MAG: GNAT family N-acetyltransferase [Anaerolineae bacterium]
MEIETPRLTLRSFQPDDLDVYHEQIYSDPDVMLYLPGGVPRSRERTNEVLEFTFKHEEEHGITLWAVINKEDNRFIGQCGLVYLKNSPDVEIAYALGKEWWGQGIATEAGAASLRYGFEVGGLPRILGLAVPANTASQRVMQKIGMQYQGETTQYYNTTLALYRIERDQWMTSER